MRLSLAASPAPADITQALDKLRQRFWVASLTSYKPKSYVYYGNQQGQFFGLRQLGDDNAEIVIGRPVGGSQRHYYRYHGILGTPKLVSIAKDTYDPRKRPWYKLALTSKQAVWTPLYLDFDSRNLLITRARRVESASGHIAGVVATDISLGEISQFLATLDLKQHDRAFILDGQGNVVAAAHSPITRLDNAGHIHRVIATQSNDPAIKAAAGTLGPIFEHLADETQQTPALFQTRATAPSGHTYLVAARPIVGNLGLDWVSVIAISRKAMLTHITHQLWIAGGISLVAIIGVILLGLLVFGRIANDVRVLSLAVGKMRQGKHKTPIHVRRKDEIGSLAHNFRAMRTSLFTDRLTGIANRTALSSWIDSAMQETEGPPFTLFFIDLDKFKPINDQYGHDNGDLALIEVATRLKAVLRPEDIVARLGGDEFVVIAAGVEAESAIRTMQRKLLKVIEKPLTTLVNLPDGVTLSVGASIGHAVWPYDADSQTTLIKHADETMYAHKQSKVKADNVTRL